MAGVVCVRVAWRDAPGAQGQARHDWRAVVPRYADPDPAGPRVVSLYGGAPDWPTVRAAQDARLARRRGGRPPERRFVAVLIGLDRAAAADVREGRVSLEAADEAVCAAVQAEWGGAVLYVVRHTDESTPHWQVLVDAIDDHGRALSARYRRPADLSALQDRVGAAVQARVGWTRGVRRAERVARGERPPKHRSVAQLHRELVSDLAVAHSEIAQLRALVARLEHAGDDPVPYAP